MIPPPSLVFLCVGFTILTAPVSPQDFDCSSFVADPAVSRIDKIYRCLGTPRQIPKMIVYQVCPQLQKTSGLVGLNTNTPGVRPEESDITYQFQQVDAQTRITSDIVNTTAGLSFKECSMACTGNPVCLSFGYTVGNACIVSSTCNPSGAPEAGTSMYNIATWYLA